MHPFQHTLNICLNPGKLAAKVLSKKQGNIHICYDDDIPTIRRQKMRTASGYYCVTQSGKYWHAHYTLYGKKIKLYVGTDKEKAIQARKVWEKENE